HAGGAYFTPRLPRPASSLRNACNGYPSATVRKKASIFSTQVALLPPPRRVSLLARASGFSWRGLYGDPYDGISPRAWQYDYRLGRPAHRSGGAGGTCSGGSRPRELRRGELLQPRPRHF